MIAALLAAMAAAAPTGRGVRSTPSAPEGLDAAWAPRRVALVVGIDQYRDALVPPLSYAARDARDIAAALSAPELGGFDRVALLDGRVDRAAFWEAFATATADLERNDTFVLYFAGHGTLDWTSESETALFLLPSDVVLERAASTAIPLSEIDARIAALRTERRVVVLDTCYSGLGRSAYSAAVRGTLRGLRGRAPIASRDALTSRYEARLYAADYHEPASEDPSLGNGVYTHFLVSGLRSGRADLDGDGRVELIEAHWWAQRQTVAHTSARQNPWMEVTQVGDEWLFLTPEIAPRQPTGALLYVPLGEEVARGLPQAPLTVRVDGEDQDSGRIEPGPHRFDLVRAGRTSRVLDLEIAPGDRIDAAALSRVPPSDEARTLEEAIASSRPGALASVTAGLGAPLSLARPPLLSASGWYAARRSGVRAIGGGSAGLGLVPTDWLVGSTAARLYPLRASAGAGVAAGDRLTAAATLELGTLARLVRVSEGGARSQAAATIGVAGRLWWSLAGRWSLAADAGLLALPAEGRLELAPTASAGLGLRTR